MLRFLFSCLVPFSCLLLACSGHDGMAATPLEPEANPIIGGVPDKGHEAVGALVLDRGLCTGTLIAPNVVLTAAHCLEDMVPKYFVLGSSVTGVGPIIPAVASEVHPDYDLHRQHGSVVAWHDMGVVVLAEPAPVEPMPWRTRPMEGMEGSPVTFVGFGRTDPNSNKAGTKFKLETTIAEVWDKGFWNVTRPSDPHNTCHGDSGGPAIVVREGREEIAGVVSSGDAGCLETGYSVRVDVDTQFLGQMVARYAKPSAPEPTPDAVESGDAASDQSQDTPKPTPEAKEPPQAQEATQSQPTPCGGITYEGCCAGQVVRWCDEEGLHELDCTEAPLCGWDDESGFYDCGTDGLPDPNGAPMKCK